MGDRFTYEEFTFDHCSTSNVVLVEALRNQLPEQEKLAEDALVPSDRTAAMLQRLPESEQIFFQPDAKGRVTSGVGWWFDPVFDPDREIDMTKNMTKDMVKVVGVVTPVAAGSGEGLGKAGLRGARVGGHPRSPGAS